MSVHDSTRPRTSAASRGISAVGHASRARIKLITMHSDIENLLLLQQADKEIRRLSDEVAELPRRVAAIEAKLAATRGQLEKAHAAVKADEATRRKRETTIQDQRVKISKYRDQALDVKTNEQYKALMHEISFAEQEIRTTEDSILELMVSAEKREGEVKAAEAEMKAEVAEIEKEKTLARERTAEDESQLVEWRGKREGFRGTIESDLLAHYDRVSKFRGTGIAEVRGQKCQGCQVMLRPQTYNELLSGDRLVCDTCQRILYYDPSHDTPADAQTQSRPRRHRPRLDAPQAWYYRADFEDAGEVFICMIKSEGQSSRRVFDLHSGRLVGDILAREGDYRQAFPENITGAIRLNGSWSEDEMETWGAEIPSQALDSLVYDLAAARTEMTARPGSKHGAVEEVPSEQAAR
jgi:uncharacterized protein